MTLSEYLKFGFSDSLRLMLALKNHIACLIAELVKYFVFLQGKFVTA
jgi:hypothetical protein